MVVSFPPAGPADESSERVAPVTSLFGRRPAPDPAAEPDGWFVGQTDDAPVVAAPVVRPVAPLRRTSTERDETEATPPGDASSDAPVATSPTTPPEPAPRTLAWTSVVEAPEDDDADDRAEVDEVDAPVDPEVRLAELDLLAVRRLARRGCSEWEIAELLRGHDAAPDEVEHVLAELRRRGYLDDAELARQLVESLHTRKGQSRAVIGRELSSRRIDASIVSEALEAIDDDDELRRALVVAEKRAGQLRSLDQATAERRLSAYLARRGYGSAIIREACSRALSGSKRSGVSFR
ncbi:regulatory protein RecX [Plantibacter flavus]|uniref:regulatory protein RecX n=1 Tax=Plantibacter TaxID=190323 RepID=UPI001784EB49|nr:MULTISPECIES: regulatory protein RecX [Plantibacter]MBD8468138.1 regulatory protein RecX [Plantibacter sp. CFBP 8798]MDD9154478.1 regulatory protein RecX [Plantibacter flavus]